MKKMLIVAPLAALLLSACVAVPVDHGSRIVVAPALPMYVELGVEPYYYHQGYYYHYDNSNWRYSNSRSGPWADLPRSHYPKETRYRGRKDAHAADTRGRDTRSGDQDDDRRDRR